MQPTAHAYILIVDDDSSITSVLADTLTLVGGYEVATAADGVAGLESIAARRPDCIVLDVRMPHLNGIQFVRALRGDPTTADIPLVILSALVQDHELLQGLFSGADAYLRKPSKINDLLGAIQQALTLTAAQRQQRMADLAQERAPDESR